MRYGFINGPAGVAVCSECRLLKLVNRLGSARPMTPTSDARRKSEMQRRSRIAQGQAK